MLDTKDVRFLSAQTLNSYLSSSSLFNSFLGLCYAEALVAVPNSWIGPTQILFLVNFVNLTEPRVLRDESIQLAIA